MVNPESLLAQAKVGLWYDLYHTCKHNPQAPWLIEGLVCQLVIWQGWQASYIELILFLVEHSQDDKEFLKMLAVTPAIWSV